MRFFIFGFLSIFLIISPVSAWLFPTNSTTISPSSRNTTCVYCDTFSNFTGCHHGQNVNGLKHIKKYFQRFGYISNNSGNFTDDFDDILKTAVELYQKNFRLKVTGELDEHTIKNILMPRCGNPDVVNGVSLMHGRRRKTFEINFSRKHLHVYKHYTTFPGEPKWPVNCRNLTYAFDPNKPLSKEFKGAFAHAFSRWSDVTLLNFSCIDSFTTSDITIGFYSGDHGDGEPFDGVLGTLAHAFSPPSGKFHLDADENWVVSGNDLGSFLPSTSAVDLESVAVHEIGHLLGLGHSAVENSIMYPTITSGRRRVELTNDDVKGIQYLYGVNPHFNGTISPPSNNRNNRETYSAAWRIDSSSKSIIFSVFLSTIGFFL